MSIMRLKVPFNIILAGLIYLFSPTAFIDTFLLALGTLTLIDIYSLLLEK